MLDLASTQQIKQTPSAITHILGRRSLGAAPYDYRSGIRRESVESVRRMSSTRSSVRGLFPTAPAGGHGHP